MSVIKEKRVFNGYYIVRLVEENGAYSVHVLYPVNAHADTSDPLIKRLDYEIRCKSAFSGKHIYRKLKDGEAIQRIVFGHAPNYLKMYE